jgi:hypothetical protein
MVESQGYTRKFTDQKPGKVTEYGTSENLKPGRSGQLIKWQSDNPTKSLNAQCQIEWQKSIKKENKVECQIQSQDICHVGDHTK